MYLKDLKREGARGDTRLETEGFQVEICLKEQKREGARGDTRPETEGFQVEMYLRDLKREGAVGDLHVLRQRVSRLRCV